MAQTAGVLLVVRSNAYHALDFATGNEHWVITNPANDTPQTPAGVIAASNIFLIYGGGALQTIDPADQHIIWSQRQSDGFQYSKSTLYATVCSQISCDHEVLYAINATTGETGWKFAANSIYNVRVSPDGNTIAFQTDSSTWGNLIEHF
jgi:outer membrane protein assembly factor BamB